MRVLPVAILAAGAVAYFALMVTGMVRWYSPVPVWDMWDSYLMSYIISLEYQDWSYVFRQTNEHRIWFSNALFYIDLTYFKGLSLFLIPFNALLAALLWLTLAVVGHRLLKDRPNLALITAFGLAPLCFSWLQENNLTWGFQSQFFVAYLFPLAAFACMALSFTAQRPRVWFIGAILFGLASLGTMANGVIVLPLLLVMSLIGPRLSWKRAACVGIVAALAVWFWFQGYRPVPRDAASLSDVVTFILTFLGFPFAAAHNTREAGYVAGGFMIAASLGFAAYWLRGRASINPMVLALLSFLAYIGATGVIIAFGRASYQPNAALISRYATPSVLAWAALALLFAYVLRGWRFAAGPMFIAGIAAVVGLLPIQRQVFSETGPNTVHAKDVGALALKLRVADLDRIGILYPTTSPQMVENVRVVAQKAETYGLSIMAEPHLAAAAAAVGTRIGGDDNACQGLVEGVEPIAGEDAHQRLSGWAFDDRARRIPRYVYLVRDGVIEGIGVTGGLRRDVASAVGEEGLYGGFTAYARGSAGDGLHVYCPQDPR